MLTFFAFALILSVGTSLLIALNTRKNKKVNWPHVYEMEHEIWPEIQHERNHYFNVETDCRTCFNQTRIASSRATPFLTKPSKESGFRYIEGPTLINQDLLDRITQDPITVKMPPDPGYHRNETRPPPPKYISVRASNESLVATYSANTTTVQTMAFETLRIQCLGEVLSLAALLMDRNPRLGDCYWVRSEREYYVSIPHKGWSKI